MNFLKISTIISTLTGFFLVEVFGTPILVGDLIWAHVLGQTNLTNAIGATGTIFVAIGLVSLGMLFVLGTFQITKENNGDVPTVIVGTILFAIGALIITYSSMAIYYGLGLIKNAYLCDIYGLDAFMESVEMAPVSNIPWVVSGIATLAVPFFYLKERDQVVVTIAIEAFIVAILCAVDLRFGLLPNIWDFWAWFAGFVSAGTYLVSAYFIWKLYR